MPLAYKLLLAALMLATAFTGGLLYERAKLSAYKGEVKGVAEQQVREVKAVDGKNEGSANATEQSYVEAITGVDAYYKSHPVVRVQYRDCTSPLPETASDPKGVDATAASGYVSPYSPSDTEQIAVRLDALQRLLVADGVTVQ